MRKKEKEVADTQIIEEIIKAADVIRIGLVDNNEPYIVPMNFGYEAPYFYMHCANEGRKIDIIKINPSVCFELDTDHNLKTDSKACGWTMTFRSVMGTGKIEILKDIAAKDKGLTVLMDQYNPEGMAMPYDFSKLMNRTTVLRLKVESIRCKVKE